MSEASASASVTRQLLQEQYGATVWPSVWKKALDRLLGQICGKADKKRS